MRPFVGGCHDAGRSLEDEVEIGDGVGIVSILGLAVTRTSSCPWPVPRGTAPYDSVDPHNKPLRRPFTPSALLSSISPSTLILRYHAPLRFFNRFLSLIPQSRTLATAAFARSRQIPSRPILIDRKLPEQSKCVSLSLLLLPSSPTRLLLRVMSP